MKDLKKTFTHQFAVSAVGSAALLAFMTLPYLESARIQLAANTGTSPALLWLFSTLLIVGLQFLGFRSAIKKVATPFNQLMREAEHGTQGFAFKTRSKSAEEDGIKHAIEAANLRAREANDHAEELEAELGKSQNALSAEQTKSNTLQERFDELDNATRNIRVENETLKASQTALELTLENERKSKVGAEVEKRAEEIYSQMERAVSAAAIKNIWIPSLVHELKTPISIIDQISGDLSNSWTKTSIHEVEKQIHSIKSQSQTQLKLLEQILERSVPENITEPPALILETEKPSQASTPKPERQAEEQPLFAIEDELEEDEPAKDPQPIGLEPKTEERPAPSPHSLEAVLGNITREFSAKIADVHYSYAFDKDLEIELEDPDMLSLLHTLTESASCATLEGEIIIGVDLQPEDLIFDVVCNGELSPHIDPILLSRAEREAQGLGGKIEVESTTATELHLSFTYPLAAPKAETIDVS